MIWLLIPIAIGLGFVTARALFDMHKAHVDTAMAQQATALHIQGAQTAETPAEAAAHIAAAKAANQVAASKVIEVASNATSDHDKRVASLMAQLTDLNRRQIDLSILAMSPAPPSLSVDPGIVDQTASAIKYSENVAAAQAEVTAAQAKIRSQLAFLGIQV